MITEKCQMSCAHCCYDCGPEGQDMSFDTFVEALKHEEEVISIGGGEPTLHPEFWKLLAHAIGHCDGTVWLATNGARTSDALTLAKMAKRGVISAALSQDEWHDPVDPEVIRAFTRTRPKHHLYPYEGGKGDLREIRSIREVMPHGRALKHKLATGQECCCDDLLVKPDGSFWWCGCTDAPQVGNAKDGIIDARYYESDRQCWWRTQK